MLRFVDNLWITAAAGALALVAACGDDDIAPGPDGGAQENPRLVVVEPGDAIGLPFGASETLRVRYETAGGDPIAGAAIEFAFDVSAAETTGGASLSATQATTDGGGVAAVVVTAGVERANFRVRAMAPSATPVLFFVAVSELGFADLAVIPVSEGWRDPADYARVELRLYQRSHLGCEAVNIDDLPASVFPPRTLDGFGGQALFRNLSALEPYTLVAWGELLPGGVAAALGCATLGATQLPPTTTARIAPPVIDRDLALPDVLDVASAFDLTPVAEQTGADLPWRALACPAGPGQLLLDAMIDATADAELIGAIDARRDAPGVDGCRPDTGLDAQLAGAFAAGGGPLADPATLAGVVAARADIAAGVELRSSLSPLADGALRHRLRDAVFTHAERVHIVPLAGSARPIVAAEPVAAQLMGDALALASHAFTLRLGDALRDAFIAIALAPLGLESEGGALGNELALAIAYESETGCDAASALVCDALGRASTCLLAACTAAVATLDAELDAWWRPANGAGLDFLLTGTLDLLDADADLAVDAVLTGAWTAELAGVPIEGTAAASPVD